jgi:elongation factor G
MGAVTADLTVRRGQVLGTRASANGQLIIESLAPLAELSDYASKFKAITADQGAYTLEFSHYETAPPKLQAELAAQWRPKAEEE